MGFRIACDAEAKIGMPGPQQSDQLRRVAQPVGAPE